MPDSKVTPNTPEAQAALAAFRAHLADRVKANKSLRETWAARMKKEPTEAQAQTYKAIGTLAAFEAMLSSFDRLMEGVAA
jgi:hypothetical protein